MEDNTVRPPSAFGYLTPTNYAKAWTTTTPNAHTGSTNNRGPVDGDRELVAVGRRSCTVSQPRVTDR
jgi:hypothetical protein